MVECFPQWLQLGHPPHSKPLGRRVRFRPESGAEYQVIQRYLSECSRTDSTVGWFCCASSEELPTKVGVKMVEAPRDTFPKNIVEDFRRMEFPATYARAILRGRFRPGIQFHLKLNHLKRNELYRLYDVNEVLNIILDITIEAWHGKSGPSQCHCCQGFGHASDTCAACAFREST